MVGGTCRDAAVTDLVETSPRRSPDERWSRAGDLVPPGQRDAVDVIDLTEATDVAEGRVPAPTSCCRADGHVVLRPMALAEMRDPLASNWLTPAERQLGATRGSRGRAAFVSGRVAAKQAVITHLSSHAFTGVDAARIEIINDHDGRPDVVVRGARVAARNLRVSIAHRATLAVAVASTARAAVACGLGIDVEIVEERSHRFERLTMTPAEHDLAPVEGDDRDTWLTRLWTAKEAAAKATGRGLRGRPKDFEVTTRLGEWLQVAGRWVLTEQLDHDGVSYLVAVTDHGRTECTWHRS